MAEYIKFKEFGIDKTANFVLFNYIMCYRYSVYIDRRGKSSDDIKTEK